MEQRHMIMSALGIGVGVGVGLGLASGGWAAPGGASSSSSSATLGEKVEQELMRMVVDGRESKVTFEEFPYYIRFLRGDQYAIALALLDEGRVVLGVLGCPNLPLASICQLSLLKKDSAENQTGCLFSA